jgi:hypothetical protein
MLIIIAKDMITFDWASRFKENICNVFTVSTSVDYWLACSPLDPGFAGSIPDFYG